MSTALSRILRIILVFSLTFMFTWHLEYSLAYGDETTDTPTSEGTPSSDDTTTPGDTGSGEGDGGDQGGSGDEGGDQGGSDGDQGGSDGDEGGSQGGSGDEGGSSDEPVINKYTVIWLNEDGTTLKTEGYSEGETPAYTGDEPTKAEDNENTYTFAGWDPDIAPIASDTTYTAVFTSTPKPESYAYVNTVEILKAEGTWDPKDEKETFGNNESLKIKLKKDAEKEINSFRARVTYFPDSNNTSGDPESVTHTKEEGLSALTNGLLPDLIWEIYTTDDGKETSDSERQQSVPEDQVKIDVKTGELTVFKKPEKVFFVHVYSENGINHKRIPGHTIRVEVSDESDPEESDPEQTEEAKIPLRISYDANGGSGTVEPTTSDANYIATIADGKDLTPPPSTDKAASSSEAVSSESPASSSASSSSAEAAKLVFSGWNTAKDGTGESFQPGDKIKIKKVGTVRKIERLDAEGNPLSDQEAASGTPENTEEAASSASLSSSSGEAEAASEEKPEEITLYAQWKPEERDTNTTDDTDLRSALLSIHYIPMPLGKNAYLFPILANVGHLTWYYTWEVSNDGGSTWSSVENKNILHLEVPTTAETIGQQYRVNAHTDKPIGENGSKVITSKPVTIREIGADEFVAILIYDPKYEEAEKNGEGKNSDAVLQVQCPNGGGDGAEYEWYMSKDFGQNWKQLDATGPTHYVPTEEGTMADWYRVRVTRKGGTTQGCDTDLIGLACNCGPSATCTNVQMIVARSDADPKDLGNPDEETPGGPSPEIPEVPADGDDGNGNGGDNNNGNNNNNNNNNNNDNGGGINDSNNDGGGSNIEGTVDDNANSEDSYIAPNSEGQTPSPETPQPAPQPAPAPQNDSQTTPSDKPGVEIDASDLVVDPNVSEIVSGETLSDTQPGARWRKLAVIPPQEEIKEVLESNPFAPFTMPLSAALLMCGVTERIVFFRRQTKDSGARFDQAKLDKTDAR